MANLKQTQWHFWRFLASSHFVLALPSQSNLLFLGPLMWGRSHPSRLRLKGWRLKDRAHLVKNQVSGYASLWEPSKLIVIQSFLSSVPSSFLSSISYPFFSSLFLFFFITVIICFYDGRDQIQCLVYVIIKYLTSELHPWPLVFFFFNIVFFTCLINSRN